VIKKIAKFAILLGIFALVVAASAYVTLTWIVRAEETVVVPDLRDKELVTVLEILTDLGLNAKVKELEYHPLIPKSQVVFQDPAAGDEVKKGRDVRIVISKGPKTVYMPNLTDRSIPSGLIVIEENGLCMGNLSETYSGLADKGRIMAQEPPPGTTIDRSRCVNLLVSLGKRPRPVVVPDLTGLKIDAALRAIEKRNLIAGELSEVFEKNRPHNVILGQNPLSGDQVVEGSRIDLFVNRNPGLQGAEIADQANRVLYRYRVKDGFLNHHILVQLRGPGRSIKLFDDFVKPGRELWFLVPKGQGARILFYDNGKLVKNPRFKVEVSGFKSYKG
jgi:beta-lactam-binding protein with PASTA domain